ncbi:MAG: S1C family serine protease, partial [Cytophagaceae bacterium]
ILPQIAQEHDINDLSGVYVQEVNPGSAAEEAGLQNGDVIIAVEGNEVNSTSEVQEIVALERPGAELNITYKRNGSTNDTTVTLKPENGEAVGRN